MFVMIGALPNTEWLGGRLDLDTNGFVVTASRDEDGCAFETSLPGIYAVGDIHGRADLLIETIDRIDEDRTRRPISRTLEVYLGDYIDRGPNSAGVLRFMMTRTFMPWPPLPLKVPRKGVASRWSRPKLTAT